MTSRAFTALLVCILVWASAFPAIRLALKAFSPGPLALFRFVVAALALTLYGMRRGSRWPQKMDLVPILLCGILGGAFYHVAHNYGQQTVPAGVAAFLINTSPVFTALLARFFLKEKLLVWGWVGMLISVCGVTLLALREGKGFEFDSGAFIVVLAALSASIYTVRQKPLLEKYTALEFTTYVAVAGSLCLMIFLPQCLREIGEAPLKINLAVIYMGLVPAAIGYVCWSYVLSQMPVSTAVSYMYVVPVVVMTMAWLFLNETPGRYALPGGALALGGVILVQRHGRVPVNPKPETPNPNPIR